MWELISLALGAIVAVITIYKFIRSVLENLMQKHTESLHKDILGVKEDIREIREDMKTQGQRTDRLYQMFVDLLKSQKPKTNP